MIPMNMIPFVARMDNTREVEPKPGPQPEPINPREFFEKVVTLDLGEAEKVIWGQHEVYSLPNIDDVSFALLREFAQEHAPNVPAFKLKFEGKDYIIVSYNTYGNTSIEDLVDIDMDDASMTEHHTFEYIQVEMDAETGDSIVILIPNEEGE